MHKSPVSWHPQTVIHSDPTRGIRRFAGANVLLAAAICLTGATYFTLISPVRAVAQDKPPAAASTAQPPAQPIAPAVQPIDLSDEVVRDVLTNFQRGMEDHNLDRVLDVFDADNMKDYAQFHDQMVAFFRLHDSVKLRYQLLQVSADKDEGFAIADIEMDADPYDNLPTPQRRSTQMRFHMKRGPKGWKVTGLRPSDFFNQ